MWKNSIIRLFKKIFWRDKIRKYIHSPRKVVTLFLGLCIALLWGFLDWVRDISQPFWKTLLGKEVWYRATILIVILMIFLFYFIRVLSEMPSLHKKIDNVIKIKDRLIETTCSVLKDITHLEISEEIIKKNEELVTDGLEAVKLNYQVWSNHVNQTKDEYLQECWLYYLRTYFREEAFDIQRKEIITNARNYPFILITTLLALVKSLEKKQNCEKKVYFYTVTPVHPKDWYNWPHGRVKPRNYYEISFIGQYRRILREIKKWEKYKYICHGRFLIVANEKEITNKFGWELDEFRKVIGTNPDDIHLKDWKLIDIPISLSNLKSYPDLNKIYSKLVEGREERIFIPLICVKTHLYQRCLDIIVASRDIENQIESLSKDTSIQETKKSEILLNIQKNLGVIDDEIKYIRNDKLIEARKLVGDYLNNKNVDIITFVENIQYLSLIIYKKYKCLDDILLYALRLKDFSSNINCYSLLEKFVEDLHSDDGQAAVVNLYQNNHLNTPFCINYWKNREIPSEFAMFGIGPKNARNGEDIQWKIVLMTDLDYPFKVSGMRFYTDDDQDASRFNIFKDTLNALINTTPDGRRKIDLKTRTK